MKLFTLILTLLFSVIVIDLVGQSTVMTLQGSTTTIEVAGNPIEPLWIYEDTADKVDSLTAVLSIKAYDDTFGHFTMHLGWAPHPKSDTPHWYVYLFDGGAQDWYSCEPFFNTKGLYRVKLLHPRDGSCVGEILITETGITISFRSMHGLISNTHGYSGDYVSYTGIKEQPNRVAYYMIKKSKWSKL